MATNRNGGRLVGDAGEESTMVLDKIGTLCTMLLVHWARM